MRQDGVRLEIRSTENSFCACATVSGFILASLDNEYKSVTVCLVQALEYATSPCQGNNPKRNLMDRDTVRIMAALLYNASTRMQQGPAKETILRGEPYRGTLWAVTRLAAFYNAQMLPAMMNKIQGTSHGKRDRAFYKRLKHRFNSDSR